MHGTDPHCRGPMATANTLRIISLLTEGAVKYVEGAVVGETVGEDRWLRILVHGLPGASPSASTMDSCLCFTTNRRPLEQELDISK